MCQYSKWDRKGKIGKTLLWWWRTKIVGDNKHLYFLQFGVWIWIMSHGKKHVSSTFSSYDTCYRRLSNKKKMVIPSAQSSHFLQGLGEVIVGSFTLNLFWRGWFPDSNLWAVAFGGRHLSLHQGLTSAKWLSNGYFYFISFSARKFILFFGAWNCLCTWFKHILKRYLS